MNNIIGLTIGSSRNGELIINTNNILLNVINNNLSTVQFITVLTIVFYIVSLLEYNVF